MKLKISRTRLEDMSMLYDMPDEPNGGQNRAMDLAAIKLVICTQW